MIASLFKLGLSGGVVSSMVFINVIPNDFMTGDRRNKKEISQSIEGIKGIDDIELYEKIHGCSFVFVKGWEPKEPWGLYGVREFLEKDEDAKEAHKKEEWINKAVEYANNGKASCTSGAVVTAFKDGGGFLERPSQGWDKFDT